MERPPAGWTGYLELQSDGNLVLYDAGRAVFYTATAGIGEDLVLQSDGNLVLYHGASALWNTRTVQPATGGTQLAPNQVLTSGETLSAADGRFTLAVQSDGNLVLYQRGIALWNTHTAGDGPVVLILQTDDNLVLYRLNGPTVWSSHTANGGGTQAVLQGDGNFVLYAGSVAKWSTQTSQPASGVGVYGGFGSATTVQAAIGGGWPVIADAGGLGMPSSPYTAEVGAQPDLSVAQGLSSTHASVSWLSFWTVSGPVAGDTWSNAGTVAGQQAATTLDGYGGKPAYIVLDAEGYNGDEQSACGSGLNGAPATSAHWSQFLVGWATGIRSVNPALVPAFYADQCQYSNYDLSAINLPAFVAVSPVLFGSGNPNAPYVSGTNILGYISYYGSCPAAPDEAAVAGWGGVYNTVQFSDSGVDCGA